MGETTGLEAKTIHRLLEFDPGAFRFTRSAELPLECDLLVVDEVSMVDVPLLASLLDALPTEGALLLVGINGSWRVMPQPWLQLLLR
jgi:exodeoxyribonuclease V alpha subunit